VAIRRPPIVELRADHAVILGHAASPGRDRQLGVAAGMASAGGI
jgi:hypothetical protein